MKTKLLLIIFILLTGAQCKDTPGFYNNELPVTPYGIHVYPLSQNRFVLTYYVVNKEDTFDGYNLYITLQSKKENPQTTNLKTLTAPYLTNGSLPTFVHTKNDVDVNNYKEVIIDKYMLYNQNLDGSYSTTFVPFVSGNRYYFHLTSHSIFGLESQYASNEVSAVAAP